MTEKEKENENENKEVELFDTDGNVVEGAMNPEQIKTKLEEFTKEKEEAIELIKTEGKTVSDELQKTIDGLKEEMDKFTDKDKNFAALRKKKEEAEELLGKVGEKFKGEFDEIKKELKEGKLDVAIKGIVGEDLELHEKVKGFYETFEGDPKDKTEMKERIKNAYTLATGAAPKDPLDSSVIGSGGTSPIAKQYKGKISEGAVEVAKNLGITEEDLKKQKLV